MLILGAPQYLPEQVSRFGLEKAQQHFGGIWTDLELEMTIQGMELVPCSMETNGFPTNGSASTNNLIRHLVDCILWISISILRKRIVIISMFLILPNFKSSNKNKKVVKYNNLCLSNLYLVV